MKDDMGFVSLLFLIGILVFAIALMLEESKNKALQKIVNEHSGCPKIVRYRTETQTEGLRTISTSVPVRVLWWGVTYECVPVEEKNEGREISE